MALTPLHVRQVCLAGTPCRFLETSYTPNGPKSFCMKLAQNYYEQYKKNRGISDDTKMGNNCQGYLYLRFKQQGIDVPGG
jgi:hypothetical protein